MAKYENSLYEFNGNRNDGIHVNNESLGFGVHAVDVSGGLWGTSGALIAVRDGDIGG